MIARYRIFLLLAFASIFQGCQEKQEKENITANSPEVKAREKPLFQVLLPQQTGITFSNNIKENARASILNYQYFYNGGGVAVGDLNNDGLDDLYFSGNIVSNQLYLNKGNMTFKEVSAETGTAGRKSNWKTGVSMADVNGDGLLDLYVCYSGDLDEKYRANQLFINQGIDKNGIPSFKEQAQQYGLADVSFSTHAVFFDFDRDQDLDMFLMNHNPFMFKSMDEVQITEILKKPEPMIRVKLYRQDKGKDGSPVFTDISDQAGFPASAFTYGLGAGVADINKDGWPDIYLSNDYSAPDYLFINNRNGTFTDKLQSGIGHTSMFSMGNNISDINNDGLPDIFVLDMLPESNHRQKLLFSPDNYEQFEMYLRAGFHYQYMRNTLHINTGLDSEGTPLFSETGQLSGISNTDWSWTPLFADFDNDGWKDLFVSNGFLKDLTNLDFIKFSNAYISQFTKGSMGPEHFMNVLEKMPSTNVSNYIFKNNGNLSFSNKGQEWGVNMPSNSNGAVYSDLDNDGDLDLVTNNINMKAFIYRNEASEQAGNQYLKIKLEGDGANTMGIGAKVSLFSRGKQQYQEQIPNRGYQSSVSPVLHFGLGSESIIDSLIIEWQGGKVQKINKVSSNQLLVLKENEAIKAPAPRKPGQVIFKEVKSPLAFKHSETNVNDFKRQPLLVNPLSFAGPCLVKADVNGDGLEDIFAGGARGQAGTLFLQQRNGRFAPKKVPAFEADKESYDADALFFDANKDGKPDLYIASGGYENYLPEDTLLQDRLYLNDGNGNFTKSRYSLPAMLSSSSCVRAADANSDGYPDLFVGSRVIPGRYPETPTSYLLINDGNGSFRNETERLAAPLQNIGMVTDATWHDLNGDQEPELIVVGEWMPIKVFKIENGHMVEDTDTYFDNTHSGWWNKIIIGDFNKDQKPDLIIGNFGLNSQCKATDSEPAEMFYKDFDQNGSVDPILCFYVQGKSYPYVTRDEMLDQVSMLRTRFKNYESYAHAGMSEIFNAEELKGVGHLSANSLETTYFESSASGKLQQKKLPIEAQISPVFALTALDFDNDGNQDLLLCGNINQARLRFGKYDANYGVLLKGNGRGEFTYVPQGLSGLGLKGDVRSILQLPDALLFGMNNQEVKAYKIK